MRKADGETYMRTDEGKIFGSVNRCCYDEELKELYVNGWFLPRPDDVEIWCDGCKVKQAELGMQRSDVFQNFPEYGDKYAGWESQISKIDRRPQSVSARAIYGGVCKRENSALKVEKKVYGKIEACYYEEQLSLLTVTGCYLPRPKTVKIFLDDVYKGDAQIEVTSDHEQCRWVFTDDKLLTKPQSVTAKVIYDELVEYEERIKHVEDKIWGSVNECCYDMLTNSIIANGWYLPQPDQMKLYICGQVYEDFTYGIQRMDVYDKFEQYKNKFCGWKLDSKWEGVMEDASVIEARMLLKYNNGKKFVREISLEKRAFIPKTAVNLCEYNEIAQVLQINGWCLPVPQNIEIWHEDRLLGNARLQIQRDDVFEGFIKYRERNSGWEFAEKHCTKAIERVSVKYIWKNGETQQTDIAVMQKKYKVVSFDLFDTLVVRPVVQPTDIFKIVGIRIGNPDYFKEMRVYAEKYARKQKQVDKDDIGIDEIYDCYQELFDVTDQEKESIKSTEIQVEKEYIRPRQTLKRFYTRAKKTGAKIIIVSDMYLPRNAIEEILYKNGYTGYDGLYISSSENASKSTGKLYEKLIHYFEKENVLPKDILHIGDNLHADIVSARRKGLDTFYVPKPIALFQDNLNLSRYIRCIHTKLDNQFLAGYLANQLFDDPFTEFDKDTYCNGDEKNIGFLLFAPFLLGFSLWLLNHLEKEEYDTVYLAYRDGYLIQRIIKLLEPYWKQSLHMVPVYFSRTVRYNGYFREKDGFFRGILDYKISPDMKAGDFVEKRLLIEDDEKKKEIFALLSEKCGIQKDEPMGDVEQIFPVLKELSREYNKQAASNMSLIDKYCSQVFPEYGKVAVFDVGYRGSVVDFLRKQYGKDAYGYQILSYSFAERHTQGAIHTKSYIQYGVGLMNDIKILHNLLEDVISIEEGTAKKISEKNGELEICKEDYKVHSETLQNIQSQILKFMDGFLDLFGKDIRSLEFDRYAEFDFICGFLNQTNEKDAEIIRKMYFQDSFFLGDVSKDIYQNWYEEQKV